MTAPYITALPTPPSRADDPQNFATKADAFLGALPGFRIEANTLGDYMETKAGEAAASASAADADRIAAQAAAADADADRIAAANSAAAASGSAGNASSSAAAAAASYDSFDDRYLGAKSSDPTTDNDGNALLVGAIYFNTGSGFRGWNGSAWVALPAATAAATAFTPAGNIAATNLQAAIQELDSEKLPVGGNAVTATALQTGRTISLTGDATGTSAAFNGTGNASIAVTVAAASQSAAGKIEIATDSEVTTGTDALRAVTPAGLRNSGRLQKYFESSAQSITAGGALTIAHGLGVKPKSIELFLRCTTANNGYAVGDDIQVRNGAEDPGSNYGATAIADATNLEVRFGNAANTFLIHNFTNGNMVGAPNTSFDLILRAWA